MKEPWMRLARELNVDRHVIFFEPLPIREIVQKVADSDVGLVPKRADSFGNEAYSTKIMEFMSQGIPVVASRTKIDTFYFSDDLITFFNSGDSADLAEKITSVFRDRSVATERVVRSLKHVAENSWAVRKHEYLALIDELVGVKDRAGIRHTSIQTESQTA
jgi:glycosyltransferase involved in cell wall biosynthesis